MDSHSQVEFNVIVGRLQRDIHALTAEQALAYLAHKLLRDADGVYLYGVRRGLPVAYPQLLTSDTQLMSAVRRLMKWGVVSKPLKVAKSGQGRPRDMYRKVETPEACAVLQHLADAWENAPWNQKDGTNV
jgi:hypothetical protein